MQSNGPHSLQAFKINGGNLIVGTPGRVQEAMFGPKSFVVIKELLLLVLDEVRISAFERIVISQ